MGWKLVSGAIATRFPILKASGSAKDKAELLKRNEKLEADNAALRSKLSKTRPFTDLFHKSDGYWTWDTDTLSVVDGPFCIPCYDKDQKLMRLTGVFVNEETSFASSILPAWLARSYGCKASP
jgi:hypothetical protein